MIVRREREKRKEKKRETCRNKYASLVRLWALCNDALHDVGNGRACAGMRMTKIKRQTDKPDPMPITFKTPLAHKSKKREREKERALCHGWICLSTAVHAANRFACSILPRVCMLNMGFTSAV
jgi:hypothetical protein